MSGDQQLLAIDNGTQSLKALVFDPRGNILAQERIPFLPPYLSPQPGWAEQEPQLYWESLCRACHGLWGKEEVNRGALAGVVVTTQRATVVNVDKKGRPLRPAIVWLDQRTSENLKPVGGMWGLLFKLAHVNDTVNYLQANAESIWLRNHQPEVWKNTHKFLLLSGYLNFRLTGDYVDSTANQVGYVPFDYKKHEWASPRDWKWETLGIEPAQLPRLVEPGNLLGQITPKAAAATGLPTGLPVFAGAADKACEVLGSGGFEPQIGSLSYGTAASYNITSNKYVESLPFIPPYPAALPGAYSVEVQIFRGYWMVEWFVQEFAFRERERGKALDVAPEKLLEDLIRNIPPGADGLMLQPYWSPGLRIPGPEARGTILGFNDRHGRGHFYRAILEGLAFGLREGMERVSRRSGTRVTSLRASGGGSQCDTAMQLTADIFGLPVIRPHIYETSSLGAAMILAVGSGQHANFDIAAREMSRGIRTFEPDRVNRALYNELYKGIYLKMYRRVKPLYQTLKKILESR